MESPRFLLLVALLLSGSDLLARRVDAEAGGPKQKERAEKEVLAERERLERSRPDREVRTEPTSQSPDVRTIELLTISKPDVRRQHIEDVARTVLESHGRDLKVTSGARTNSPAHRAGALDFSSKDLSAEQRHAEAKAVSKNLGHTFDSKKHTVIVEEVHRPEPGALGPSANIHTAYRDGQRGNTRVKELADPHQATHTHVQPDVSTEPSPRSDGPREGRGGR